LDATGAAGHLDASASALDALGGFGALNALDAADLHGALHASWDPDSGLGALDALGGLAGGGADLDGALAARNRAAWDHDLDGSGQSVRGEDREQDGLQVSDWRGLEGRGRRVQ